MILTILFWLFAISSTMYIIHIAMYLIGANVYDMWQYRRLHRHHSGAEAPYEPLVTVIMSAHNEEKVLMRSLDSIARSTYPKVQIVIMDDASTDATLAIARRFKRRHPGLDMTVAHMKTNVGKGHALNRG